MMTIPLSRVERSLDSLAEVACPHCGAVLALHSPDVETPERMLATCDDCKSWYLMDLFGSTLTPLPVEVLYGQD